MVQHRSEPAVQHAAILDLTDFLIESARSAGEPVGFESVRNAADLLPFVVRRRPAIVLLDPRSLKAPGAFVAEVVAGAPGAAIGVITDISDPFELRAMLRAPVRCLLRRTGLTVPRYPGALRALRTGADTLMIDREIEDLLLDDARSLRARLPVPPFTPAPEDLEALKHAIRGVKQAEGAAQLFDGRTKYQSRLRNLRRRLRARSTEEAVLFAERMGWLDDLELPGEE